VRRPPLDRRLRVWQSAARGVCPGPQCGAGGLRTPHATTTCR
jgi:hypothetical protein